MPLRTARRYAFLAVLIMVLAGSTGSLLRFALVYGMPPGWGQIRNVVHAHSHTMFGWTILGLMTLMWSQIPRWTGRDLPRGVRWQMAATFLFSLLQLPAFWPHGYESTQIGTARLPLGAMSAGFAGLTWFWFMALYWRAVRSIHPKPLALRLWNAAVILLFIASLGAMAEPGLMIMKVENPFIKFLFLHLFLDLFTSGWLLLAILGAIWAFLDVPDQNLGWMPVGTLALAVLPTFLLGMPPDLLSPLLFWTAALANVVLAILVAWHLKALWPYRHRLPILVQFSLLGLLVQMGAAILMLAPPIWAWGVGTLRIFYLHNMLLLWASSAILGLLIAHFGIQRPRLQTWATALWIIGVALMWLALLLGGFAPWLPLTGRAFLILAAWASVIIITGAILALGLFWGNTTTSQPQPA